MKKYFEKLAFYTFASVIVLSVLTLFLVMRSRMAECIGIGDGIIKPKTIVYLQDGTYSADFNTEKLNPYAVRAAAQAEGTVTISNITYRARISDLSDGVLLVTLTPDVPIYRTIYVVTGVAFLIFAAFLCAAFIFVLRRLDREIVVPTARLSETLSHVEEGDYDVLITEEGVGEIGTLTRKAENLRLRLKNEALKTARAEEDRRFLLSAVSHDLKTPVAAVRGYLEGIRDGVADSEEKREKYLKSAIERLDTVKNMIDDLLLYTRLDSKGGSYNKMRIDMAAYIKDFAEEERVLFLSEDKSLSLTVTEESVFAMIDPESFARAVRNITENAKRYIKPKTGNVEIALRKVRDSVVIEIRDNGIGMEPAELEKIFDRFYRGASDRPSDGSVGLGLAISKRIVEDMDGKIWAVSKKGEGTSFLISLKEEKETL